MFRFVERGSFKIILDLGVVFAAVYFLAGMPRLFGAVGSYRWGRAGAEVRPVFAEVQS